MPQTFLQLAGPFISMNLRLRIERFGIFRKQTDIVLVRELSPIQFRSQQIKQSVNVNDLRKLLVICRNQFRRAIGQAEYLAHGHCFQEFATG